MSTDSYGIGNRIMIASLAGVMTLAVGCSMRHPYQQTLEAYRRAKKNGDYATAAKYLADDARIWFNKKEGPGHPLTAKGGPYKDWDREFRATSHKSDMKVAGNTLSYTSYEINDFYRLIEQQTTPGRITYYFDDDGLITGMLYRGLSSKETRPPDRFDEFKAWADAKYPGLLDSDEMKIPNQPQRWRALLVEWRHDIGEPLGLD